MQHLACKVRKQEEASVWVLMSFPTMYQRMGKNYTTAMYLSLRNRYLKWCAKYHSHDRYHTGTSWQRDISRWCADKGSYSVAQYDYRRTNDFTQVWRVDSSRIPLSLSWQVTSLRCDPLCFSQIIRAIRVIRVRLSISLFLGLKANPFFPSLSML